MDNTIQIIEETTPYLEQEVLEAIERHSAVIAEAGSLCAGFLLFFVVVLLCYFCYKFFRMFF